MLPTTVPRPPDRSPTDDRTRPDAPGAVVLRPVGEARGLPAPDRMGQIAETDPPPTTRPKLGAILLEMRAISGPDLARALLLQRQMAARLGDVLLKRSIVSQEVVADAVARQWGIGRDRSLPPPTPENDRLARKIPMEMALRYRCMPWRRVGNQTLLATARPEMLEELSQVLPAKLGGCLFTVVTENDLKTRLEQVHGSLLARGAECRVPQPLSCRQWRGGAFPALLATLILAALAATLVWPAGALRVVTALGLVVMTSNLSLRIAAVVALRRAPRPFASVRPGNAAGQKLPSISILVPLHREPDIAGPLTERLSRLDYPRELLDICLVVEADDAATRAALARANLPAWMRVIAVPDGQPRTKPRAMNYALNFTEGDIVGIYDAEDAPAPDQLAKVAARFQSAPDDVVCLQGLLDYYNPKRNWMSRCFTIEYANWFRLILPGLSRLGMAIPLGGTTLFFRRTALEAVGGWDAHNVTEDADLGVRLARMGYRTEIINTTTLEEANAHPVSWVKQRSRWMKGYILTWAVHSRHPLRLLRDLGPRRWIGFQLLFMGSILNALLMPALWSTVVIPFGLHHPITDWMPGDGVTPLAALLTGAGLTSIAITWIGCGTAHHRGLRWWIPTMELYFPLAFFAVIKALVEIVFAPFHWDKTAHGAFGGTEPTELSHAELLAPRPQFPALPGAE